MKILNVILIGLCLTGCASQKLGPSADFYSPDNSMLVESPLDISGRFNGGMCSQNFAYIDISIQNPSSEWKELKSITLDFPYGLNNQFEIVSGRKLKSWAVAQEIKEGRDNHNSQMAKLAVAGLGVGLIAGPNGNGKLAGAGLVAGVAASTEVDGVFKRKEKAEAGNSYHLLDGNLLVPPNMDRQYWMLLSAKKDAPFMDNIKVSYVDEKNRPRFFDLKLVDWVACAWQKERVSNLEDWARANSGSDSLKGIIQNGEIRGRNSIWKIESVLQEHLKAGTVKVAN